MTTKFQVRRRTNDAVKLLLLGHSTQAVIDDFIDRRRQVNRATTMRDLNCHMKRLRKTLEKKPRPQSGADLIKAYARHHFKNCRRGGSGRVVQLNNVRALLRYAIKEYGYDSRWKPLDNDDLRDLIGTDDRPTEDKLTPPVMPNDLGNLLDALRDADRTSLMLLTLGTAVHFDLGEVPEGREHSPSVVISITGP